MQKVKAASGASLVFLMIALLAVFVLYIFAKNAGITRLDSDSNRIAEKLLQKSYVGSGPYVADGVTPPTNKWFSSLAFKQPADTLFALPLAVKPSPQGIAFSQPTINSSNDAITAPFSEQIKISSTELLTQEITDYDELSVLFTQQSGDKDMLTTRLTRGSPFVFMTMMPGSQFTIDTLGNNLVRDSVGRYYTKDNKFGIYLPDNVAIKESDSTIIVTANDLVNLAVFAIPENADKTQYFKAAESPIKSTSVVYDVNENDVSMTFNINTEDNKETIYGILPFMQNKSSISLGSIPTLEGEQTYYQGNSFQFDVESQVPKTSLDLSELSPEQIGKLKELIQNDVNTLTFKADDSYFAGKELYKAARILQIANELGMEDEAKATAAKLTNELEMWFDTDGYKSRDSKFFYYDPTLRGVVASKPSFGSEEFNDHHFHYGYFITAAAILSEHDKGFMEKHRDFVNLLSDDIANIDSDSRVSPQMRNFDSYIGHSWASGFGAFNDGQNQESSSEAVNAWSGVYHWAELTKNDDLIKASRTLFARESQAAKRQWLNIDNTNPEFKNYEHPFASLIWGGKIEYGTFFSDKPEAKLGIQLIPFSPGIYQYLSSDTESIKRNLETINSSPEQFADYLLMYEAILSPAKSATKLGQIQETQLDSANSMTYLHALIYSLQ